MSYATDTSAAASDTALKPVQAARARRLWRDVAREVAARWDILGVIAAGGATGSLARWGLAAVLPHRPDAFPWATFAANVSGSLLIGALMVLTSDVWPPSRHVRPFLGVGVLGGYTTFSTFMLDTRNLLMAGRAGIAAAYLVGTLIAGLAAVWAGGIMVRGMVQLARWRHMRAAERVRGRPGLPPRGAGPAAPSQKRTRR